MTERELDVCWNHWKNGIIVWREEKGEIHRVNVYLKEIPKLIRKLEEFTS